MYNKNPFLSENCAFISNQSIMEITSILKDRTDIHTA